MPADQCENRKTKEAPNFSTHQRSMNNDTIVRRQCRRGSIALFGEDAPVGMTYPSPAERGCWGETPPKVNTGVSRDVTCDVGRVCPARVGLW